jgi:hypothetical protein
MKVLRLDGALMSISTDRMNQSGRYIGMEVELLEVQVSLGPPLLINNISLRPA